MPRKTGRDQYRPSDPDMRARAAMEREHRARIGRAIDHLAKPTPIRYSIGVGLLCIHNVPWKDCTRCSTPVKR